jgi:hypothetical protein
MTPILQGIAALNSLLSLGRDEPAPSPAAAPAPGFERALTQATSTPPGIDFSELTMSERLAVVRQFSGEPAVVTLANGTRVVGHVGYVEVRAGEAWLNIGETQVALNSVQSLIRANN